VRAVIIVAALFERSTIGGSVPHTLHELIAGFVSFEPTASFSRLEREDHIEVGAR
jgi:hypothetical protein